MYRPIQRKQIGDPTTTLDSTACTLEAGAMALDFHTLGKLQLWGGNLAVHCGKTYAYIAAHGTSLPDIQKAWSYYGYTLVNKTRHTFKDMMADLQSGRGVILQGDYDQFSYETKCQKNFLGNHGIYLNPEFGTKPTTANPEFLGVTVLMMDPLCGAPKYVPATELRKFAEKFARPILGTQSPQQILYAVTAAHPSTPVPVPTPTPTPTPTPVPVAHRISIAPKAKILLANLSASGCIASWTTKTWGLSGSSAPCKAKVYLKGCASGGATVAYVTAGVFKGRYVKIGTGVTYI